MSEEADVIGFTLTGRELKRYRKFRDHKCKVKLYDEPNPAFTIAFSPTSIGMAVTVSCHCGKSKNITDYDNW